MYKFLIIKLLTINNFTKLIGINQFKTINFQRFKNITFTKYQFYPSWTIQLILFA